MDMAGRGTNVEPQKESEDSINYHTTNASSDWQISGNNSLTNTSIGMIPMGNSMAEIASCSSAPMVDSFCPQIWDHPNLGYYDVQNEVGTSSSVAPVRGGMGWAPNAMLRGGSMFLPNVPGMLPQSLPHFPADSGFIERAARFSCFGGGNLGEMMNPFSLPNALNPYSGGLVPMQGPHEVPGGHGLKSLSGMQSERHEMNVTDVSKEVSIPGACRTEGSPFKNDKKGDTFSNEAKHGVNMSSNDSGGAEFSGRGAPEELGVEAGETSAKGLGPKKRKRTGQDANEHEEHNEIQQPPNSRAKDAPEVEQKDDQPTSAGKPGGKQGKQGSGGSDPPKEDYIHIRARRGQATNSHSLAERVRREKISERMKFLQDLVPGCSKVTGKAVMLDEIINYVQSLQRQVEFLSMKLATVNPRLDFNMEGFLAKEMLQPRAGLSSSLAFPPDMTIPFPALHPPQPGLFQTGLHGLGNASESLRRPINLQPPAVCEGFKEHTSQVPNAWEDELHNVVHMGFNTSGALNSQDLSASLPPGQMKAEP